MMRPLEAAATSPDQRLTRPEAHQFFMKPGPGANELFHFNEYKSYILNKFKGCPGKWQVENEGIGPIAGGAEFGMEEFLDDPAAGDHR